MRYFSTTSASYFTVRAVGFYPSLRVATTLASRVSWVLDLSIEQSELVALYLNGNTMPEQMWNSFTPSEQKVCKDLMDWWTVSSDEDFKKKAFVAINLNEGKSAVIVAKRTTTLDSISYENGSRRKTTWVNATLDDVQQINSESTKFAEASTVSAAEKAIPKPCAKAPSPWSDFLSPLMAKAIMGDYYSVESDGFPSVEQMLKDLEGKTPF